MTDISIAIVAYNDEEDVCRAVASIEAYTAEHITKKIYIIDNSSEENKLSALEQKYPDVSYLKTGQNLGFGGGHNKVLPLLDSRFHAIVNPDILLCDEPTGALDSKATDSLLRLFEQINAEGQTILMVTHSARAASHAGRVLFIKDGVVYHQLRRGAMNNEELYSKISETLTVLATGGKENA